MSTELLFVTDGMLQGEPEHLEWLASPDVAFVGWAETADPQIRITTAAISLRSGASSGGQRRTAVIGALDTDTSATASSVPTRSCRGEVYRVPALLKAELMQVTERLVCGDEAVEACHRNLAIRFDDVAGGETRASWIGCSPRGGDSFTSGGALLLLPAPFDVGTLMAADAEAAMSWRQRREDQRREAAPQMVFVMLDGAADTACPELGGRTPFQAAKRDAPGLSLIASHGSAGLLDPVRPGVACGSETAHLSIMGFDPALYFAGRGAFEALGGGMDMSPGDIGFKCNFARCDAASLGGDANDDAADAPTAGCIVSHRKYDDGEVATADARQLSDAIDGITVTVPTDDDGNEGVVVMMRAKHAMNHRLGIVLSLASPQPRLRLRLTAAISDTDPIVDRKPLLSCRPSPPSGSTGPDSVEGTASQRLTAAAVNLLSDEIARRLREHPINRRRKEDGRPTADVVLFRGAAGLAHQPTLAQRFGFRRPCALAPTCVIAGLFRTLGVELLPIPEGATGTEHSNLSAKAAAVIEALRWGKDRRPVGEASASGSSDRRDFCFLHVKGTDEAGHGKDARLKVDVLKRVGAMVEELWAAAPIGTVFAMASDHSTPCAVGDHTSDPVACCLGVKRDDGASPPPTSRQGFDEMTCGSDRAGLGRIAGCELMRRMVVLAGSVARTPAENHCQC